MTKNEPEAGCQLLSGKAGGDGERVPGSRARSTQQALDGIRHWPQRSLRGIGIFDGLMIVISTFFLFCINTLA